MCDKAVSIIGANIYKWSEKLFKAIENRGTIQLHLK